MSDDARTTLTDEEREALAHSECSKMSGVQVCPDCLDGVARTVERIITARVAKVTAERDARVLEDAADHFDGQESARKAGQYGPERDYADGIDAGVEGAADWLRDRARALREGQ